MVVRRGFALSSCVSVLGILAAASLGCASDAARVEAEPVDTVSQAVSSPTSAFPSTFARQWMTNFANSVKGDGFSPPLAARAYGYAGVAIYESVVHGMAGNKSLAGQLNGLDSLPQPDSGLVYDWPTVLAQTMSQFAPATYVFPLRLFFEFTTLTQASLTELGPIQIGLRQTAGVPQNVIDNSVAFGNQLAGALIAWAQSDGYSQIRFQGYVPPVCMGCWEPTGFNDPDKVALPTEPHFGNLRPLALSSPEACFPPAPPPFSSDPASALFAEATVVEQTKLSLTSEQRTIAEFWADPPSTTATPPGHWINLTTQFVRPKTLADAAAAYAMVGIGVEDAFIAIWNAKYFYNLIRPETYIRRYIDPTFKPHITTPEFPEYISGHSGVSGASATIMASVFGDGPLTDSTKLRRGFGARSFPNFMAAAQEAANSRLYGGIHYPIGNSEGINVGVCVANKVLARVKLN